IKVIKKGGVFLADNILFRGNVVKNDVGKKYEVGTSIINEFNNELAKSPYFETIFLPIGDGISFSVRI
ncbi:MAG: O-methyltransferase, partial [Spirochaetota bacterium]|nr:O-methyltransferase [Spirochaetota bacterium]